MSFLLLALMNADESDPRGTLERLMQPYYSLNGAVKRCYLLPYEVLQMAVRYNLPLENHPNIAARLAECQEWPVGVDEKGFFVERPYNPQGKWLEWVIGAEWDGWLKGEPYSILRAGIEGDWERNCVPVAELHYPIRSHSIRNVLTPTGRWYDEEAIIQSFAHSLRLCPACRTVKRCHEGWWGFFLGALFSEYAACRVISVSCKNW